MSKDPTPLQREYRESLAQLKVQRQHEYQQFLEAFANDAIKTIRALAKTPDSETFKVLVDVIELDWSDLQRLKKTL